MRSRGVLGSAVALLVVVGGSLAAAGPAPAQVAGHNGLVFFDYRPPNSSGTQVWSVNVATRATRNLSRSNVGDDQPAVSPDGGSIAFRHDNTIWTMTSTGGSRRALTVGGDNASQPTWSPDGTRIAYVDNGNLAVISAQGTGRKVVIVRGADNSQPAWSPDGTALAFTSYRVADEAQIFTVAPDGSHLVNVSKDTADGDNDPDWTPDSAHIVFNTSRSMEGVRENFEVNRDGTGIVQVSSAAPSGTYSPAASPDGAQLAMTENYQGAIQIAIESLDGAPGPGQIITSLDGTSAENLSWQPVVRPRITGPATITRGRPATVSVSGFGARETVDLAVVDSAGTVTSLGSVVAGATGAARATVTVPASVRSGSATITATGAVTDRTAQVSTTVA